MTDKPTGKSLNSSLLCSLASTNKGRFTKLSLLSGPLFPLSVCLVVSHWVGSIYPLLVGSACHRPAVFEICGS